MLLAVVLTFSLSACGEYKGDVVMSYDGFTITESDFMYISSLVKDSIIYNYQYYYYYYYGEMLDEASILALTDDSGKTVADYIYDSTVETAQRILIVESLCSKAGVTVTDEDTIAEIDSYISDLEYSYGGKDNFEIALAKLGFGRESVERFEYFNRLLTLYSDHRYGDNGDAKVSEETVTNLFFENYAKFEGCIFSYYTVDDKGASNPIVFDYTDSEVQDYFYQNYAKATHVLFATVDAYTKPLSDEEIAKAKADAEKAYEDLMAGLTTFEEICAEHKDNTATLVFTDGEMVEEFENCVYDLEIGTADLVQTKYGYHIVAREALTDADLFGTGEEDSKGIRDKVVSNMSISRIEGEAKALYEKLASGEITEFPTEGEEYYTYEEPVAFTSGSTNYADIEEALLKAEVGEYIIKDYSGDGVFIVKKLELTAEDLDDTIYEKIESSLVSDSYYQYLNSFIDGIVINTEVLERFNVSEIPMLDENFYS